MIKFNSKYLTGKELECISKYLDKADDSLELLLKQQLDARKVYLVHSCTAALEIAALSIDIKSGDEIIMPSFTYVSTANAFALRGAEIVFVDIDEQTMNIDLSKVEEAITHKTKAIVPVHYAGVSCDMDRLMELADRYNLHVIEDAAQSIYAKYNDRHLGTIGDVGCISFHDTKNITAGGSGGLLIVNDESLINKIDLIVENGTDRISFLNNQVNKYTWKGLGSSYLMSSINKGYLLSQVTELDNITRRRVEIFNRYDELLDNLSSKGTIDVMSIPEYSTINGHIYYIKVKDYLEREELIKFLYENNIEAFTHYEPLHDSEGGLKFGKLSPDCNITARESRRLLRLPIHMDLENSDIEYIVSKIEEFYDE